MADVPDENFHMPLVYRGGGENNFTWELAGIANEGTTPLTDTKGNVFMVYKGIIPKDPETDSVKRRGSRDGGTKDICNKFNDKIAAGFLEGSIRSEGKQTHTELTLIVTTESFRKMFGACEVKGEDMEVINDIPLAQIRKIYRGQTIVELPNQDILVADNRFVSSRIRVSKDGLGMAR